MALRASSVRKVTRKARKARRVTKRTRRNLKRAGHGRAPRVNVWTAMRLGHRFTHPPKFARGGKHKQHGQQPAGRGRPRSRQPNVNFNTRFAAHGTSQLRRGADPRPGGGLSRVGAVRSVGFRYVRHARLVGRLRRL
uniref:hypothetical protein n=1 Tax=Pseudonocardia sp. CA-138482 TaxID=3240023 RepID=UPI003F496721